MSNDFIIGISIFVIGILFIFFQNRKTSNSIRDDANSIANQHFPLNCKIASDTLTNIINHFSLKYNTLSIESKIWQDFGFEKHDTLIIDLAEVVSDTIEYQIDPKIFDDCITLRDIVEIAIQQNDVANKSK